LQSHPGPRLLLLGLAYAVFVVYGSLVPLEFRPREFDDALAAFRNIPYLDLGVASRADWVANILLYIPLGFLLCGAANSARAPAARIAGTLVAVGFCIALAFAVEFAQLYFPPRTVSQNDLIAETIGTLLGVALWFALGPRIVGLAGHVRAGGPRATRAALILYVAAYLAFSLFPYDFLVSGKELADKLTVSGRSAWVLSDACGDVARCNAKLLGEILLAAPLGMLYGMLRGRDRPAHYGRVFLWGLALGVAIEGLQIFLASGVSQGSSILARGLGVVWGLAFQRVFDLGWFTRNRNALRKLAWVAAPAYFAVALYIKGLLPPALDATWAALEKLQSLSFLPFYYHYYTSETEAMQSLLLNAGLYLPVGLLVWITRTPGRDRATRWIAAGAGAAVALAIETLTLFTIGKRADPTNILIAAATSYLIALGAQWLEHGFPVAAGGAAHRPRASVRTMVVLQTTSAIIAIFVLIGGLVVATPHRERPIDESVLPKLAPGHDLPPVNLPKFRVAHPRLPHPSADDLAVLRKGNPRFLADRKAAARGGHGDLEAAILTEFVEPGSQDLGVLLGRLTGMKPEGRGHDQARPLALAYDWLYDRWSDAQRAALRDQLVESCNYLIELVRTDRLSPYNVILYNAPFQALVACAIAIYRDDQRGEPIMRFTHDLWKNRVLPVWRQVMGRYGGWHEGAEYVGIGIGQAIHRVPAMWRHATGEDYVGTEPGIRGFLDFLVYRTQPDGSHFRWGDGRHFDRAAPDAIALAIELRHRPAYNLRPPPKEPVPTSWPWGPLTDPALVDRDAATMLPPVRLFDGLGLIVARSDWTPEATYVTFKAGDNFWSHVHLDQGAFTIYKGGPLAIDSGFYGPEYGSDHHMNYAYQTIAHNTITVTDPADTVPAPGREKPRPIANDGGQRRVGSGWGVEPAPLDRNEWQTKRDTYHTGRIDRLLDHNGVIAVVADLTPAYTNRLSGEKTFSARTRRVERALRVFGYDRIDDVVVVYDDVESSNAAFRKRWLLHSIDRPEILGNRFTMRVPREDAPGRGGGRLDGHVILPESHLLTAIGGPGFEFYVDGRNYDEEGKLKIPPRRPGAAGPEPGAWRIELSPQREALSDRFLVVLLPAPLGEAPAHQISRFEEGLRLGLEIKGPQRTTRWLFDRERGLADLRVIEGAR
jgi:VanZ family protein